MGISFAFALAGEQYLAEIVAQKPDLVVVEGVALLDVARGLRGLLPGDVRIVIDFHNVESLLLEEQDRARLPAAFRFLAPLVFRRRWIAARHADREAMALADGLWVCSQDDRERARFLGGVQPPISVVPNPVPAWCDGDAGTAPRPVPQHPNILFVGHLGYPPNKVAARRLAGRIMPRILKRFPGARLTVAGRSPNARLRRFIARFPHAELVADPQDLRPLYRDADMVLLPLSEGGGSRIKVLEALAVGCPVVASAKAVEGLDLEPDRHFLQAETPAMFAEAVETLMRQPELRDYLCAQAAAHVRAHHGPSAIGESVKAAVADPAGTIRKPG